MAKINQDVDFDTTPQSRVEDIIKATVDGEEYDKPAESRVEYWLIELKNAIEGGGGGGGTTNYNALSNKPQINSVELTGDKSGADLGLQSEITAQNKLDADLVDDTSSTNKFTNSTEKQIWNGKQDALTFDNTPTSGSNNPVKSGGIYTALDGKVDKVTGKGLSTNDYTDAEKTKLGKAITTDEITVESDYIVLNGIRVYVSASEPTGTIPEGSIWIGG